MPSEKIPALPQHILHRRTVMLGLAALSGSRAIAQTQEPVAKPSQAASSAEPLSQARQHAALPPEQIKHKRVEQFLLGSSQHQGEPWRIHVAWPEKTASAAGYRVIYLLDGNTSFPLAWHALQALRDGQQKNQLADQVVLVGIGYPANVRFDIQRRFFDLTPPTASEFMNGRSETRTGGQEILLDFIEHDLRPAIARHVPVDARQQALFGHSLGGLLTMHALYTRPRMFQTWIAADPSMWWNGYSILNEEAAFLAGIHAAGGHLASRLQLLIERSSGPSSQQQSNINAATAVAQPDAMDSARKLANISGMDVFFHRFVNESHPSMLKPAIHDGLQFFLDQAPPHLLRV